MAEISRLQIGCVIALQLCACLAVLERSFGFLVTLVGIFSVSARLPSYPGLKHTNTCCLRRWHRQSSLAALRCAATTRRTF